jgi:hypothetical protein
VYANSLDAFIPEVWANESVAILLENMIASSMVHRDFENELAKFGDLVHTRKPAEFVAKRKTKSDDVTVQNAEATDIQVPLNQHLHTSFTLQDEDLTKSFQELRVLFLEPAVVSLAQAMDKITLGQCYQFMANQQGHLGLGAAGTIKSYMIDTRKRMSINKAPEAARTLIIGPETEAHMLNLDTFTEADKVGDDGSALREASIGRKFGFNIYQCQNTPNPTVSVDSAASKIDLSGGYAAGTTAIHVDTAGLTDFENLAGCYIKIAGDETIQRVASESGAATQDIDLVISPGLRHAVLDDAVVTKYENALVNDSDDYAIGYAKEITVDGYTGVIEQGTLVSFSTDGAPNVPYAGVYCVISTTETTGNTTGITLDRPLALAIEDNDVIDLGPSGEVNFAFQRNCLALVIRPLVTVPGGMGAMSAIASFNDVAVRVTASYEGRAQGILITVDLLCGVATLDTNLAAIMLG